MGAFASADAAGSLGPGRQVEVGQLADGGALALLAGLVMADTQGHSGVAWMASRMGSVRSKLIEKRMSYARSVFTKSWVAPSSRESGRWARRAAGSRSDYPRCWTRPYEGETNAFTEPATTPLGLPYPSIPIGSS
jgi:hypothetical protein